METKPKGIKNLGLKTYLRLSARLTVNPGIFPEFIFMAEMNNICCSERHWVPALSEIMKLTLYKEVNILGPVVR